MASSRRSFFISFVSSGVSKPTHSIPLFSFFKVKVNWFSLIVQKLSSSFTEAHKKISKMKGLK